MPRDTALTGISSLKVLLRADAAVQMRNKRSLAISLLLPIWFLILIHLGNGKIGNKLGGPSLEVAICMTVGLVTLGVIGYSTAVARDREQGVFQRLRVTPAPTWTIMCSRFLVQIVAMLFMAVIVFLVAYLTDHLALDLIEYIFTLIVVVIGGAVFLSIGQAVVGLIRSADTLNSLGRFILIPILGLSLFGHSDLLGTTFEYISRWSPGGSFVSLLAGAMNLSSWSSEIWLAFLACMGYVIVFAGVGIRWFRWTPH
jgi:ABC-2 type transport system permease protein